MKAVRQFFNSTLQEVQVDPTHATRSTMRDVLMGCPIGLNLHGLGSIGQMESFRMALFLSNKMCVLSESVETSEMSIWGSVVRMPAQWKPDRRSRLAGLDRVFSTFQELKENPSKLADCRQTSYKLYKHIFSREQVFSNARWWINATMLRSPGSFIRGEVLGLVGGLGFAPNLGLVTQLLALLGAVVYAHEHAIKYISEDTLTFRASGKAIDGSSARFGDLFNITHWNARAMGNQSLPLPFVVQAKATEWIFASNVSKQGYAKSDGPDGEAVRGDRSVCWYWESLRPTDALLKAVDAVRPAAAYGVLHARIEDDLRAPGIPSDFWSARTPLPDMFSKIANSSHPCLSRPSSFYMCVAASDVTEPEDASILDRRVTPWPNMSLELGGSDAVRKAGLEGSRIQGALLDFEIARGAKFFLGDEGLSTFTRAIMTSRTCAGIPCNINSRDMREATFR
ncbi:unnamed protein product [Prorocentrum cordatum]|uniref:Uncharacterized protein n=1 Tax=Prorocentrum cordatum TaxID=2364126 RepID=A0ABN9PZ94_9DINO|nr:unnamed protein product [Polarella glacialis]